MIYWKQDRDGTIIPTFRKPTDYRRGDEWPEYKFAWEWVRLALTKYTDICYLNWNWAGKIVGTEEEKKWPGLSLGYESLGGRSVSIFWGAAQFWFYHKNKEFVCYRIDWNDEPYATPNLREKFEHFLFNRGLLDWWNEMEYDR